MLKGLVECKLFVPFIPYVPSQPDSSEIFISLLVLFWLFISFKDILKRILLPASVQNEGSLTM